MTRRRPRGSAAETSGRAVRTSLSGRPATPSTRNSAGTTSPPPVSWHQPRTKRGARTTAPSGGSSTDERRSSSVTLNGRAQGAATRKSQIVTERYRARLIRRRSRRSRSEVRGGVRNPGRSLSCVTTRPRGRGVRGAVRAPAPARYRRARAPSCAPTGRGRGERTRRAAPGLAATPPSPRPAGSDARRPRTSGRHAGNATTHQERGAQDRGRAAATRAEPGQAERGREGRRARGT